MKKVISFDKYFEARQRAKAESKFIAGELRKAAAETGITEEMMFSGGPGEDELTEIYFQRQLRLQRDAAKRGSGE